jgi:hypothetical protein
MRVLIIADGPFAARERSMLSRLEVGLADEGIRVVHAIPRQAAQGFTPELFSEFLTYDEGLTLSRFWRVQRFVRSLEESTGESVPVDLVHVFGERAWAMAAEIASQTGAGLIIETWSASHTRAAAQARAGVESGASLLLTPDPAILSRLQTEDPNGASRLAPWGVHTPPAPLNVLRDEAAISAVIIAGGRDPAALAAALEGIAQVLADNPDLMVFAEAEAIERARLWPLVKHLGIVDRFTLAPDLEARRELALRADLLILPESLGDHRTLTLDAMAAGMVVVAAADPMVSELRDGQTARLVDAPRAKPWTEALGWALRDRAAARALGLSAREHIRANCRASGQIAAVVDAYEWMLQGEAIPFDARA